MSYILYNHSDGQFKASLEIFTSGWPLTEGVRFWRKTSGAYNNRYPDHIGYNSQWNWVTLIPADCENVQYKQLWGHPMSYVELYSQHPFNDERKL